MCNGLPPQTASTHVLPSARFCTSGMGWTLIPVATASAHSCSICYTKKVNIWQKTGIVKTIMLLISRIVYHSWLIHLTNVFGWHIFLTNGRMSRLYQFLNQTKSCRSFLLPISLLTTISEVFEKVVWNRMIVHGTENSIFNNEQFGFRHRCSTTHQL